MAEESWLLGEHYMKHFSEAIRDGSKKNEQCLIGWTGVKNRRATTCAAAAGLMDLGLFHEEEGGYIVDHRPTTGKQFWSAREGRMVYEAETPEDVKKFLYSTGHGIPNCGCNAPDSATYNVLGVIIHLNDYHKWTREAISEWVETIERKMGLWDEKAQEDIKTEVINSPVAVGQCVVEGSKV